MEETTSAASSIYAEYFKATAEAKKSAMARLVARSEKYSGNFSALDDDDKEIDNILDDMMAVTDHNYVEIPDHALLGCSKYGIYHQGIITAGRSDYDNYEHIPRGLVPNPESLIKSMHDAVYEKKKPPAFPVYSYDLSRIHRPRAPLATEKFNRRLYQKFNILNPSYSHFAISDRERVVMYYTASYVRSNVFLDGTAAPYIESGQLKPLANQTYNKPFFLSYSSFTRFTRLLQRYDKVDFVASIFNPYKTLSVHSIQSVSETDSIVDIEYTIDHETTKTNYPNKELYTRLFAHQWSNVRMDASYPLIKRIFDYTLKSWCVYMDLQPRFIPEKYQVLNFMSTKSFNFSASHMQSIVLMAPDFIDPIIVSSIGAVYTQPFCLTSLEYYPTHYQELVLKTHVLPDPVVITVARVAFEELQILEWSSDTEVSLVGGRKIAVCGILPLDDAVVHNRGKFYAVKELGAGSELFYYHMNSPTYTSYSNLKYSYHPMVACHTLSQYMLFSTTRKPTSLLSNFVVDFTDTMHMTYEMAEDYRVSAENDIVGLDVIRTTAADFEDSVPRFKMKQNVSEL